MSLEPPDSTGKIANSRPAIFCAQCLPGPPGPPRGASERKQAGSARQRERQRLMHLLQASDRERQGIAYAIHDGVAQQLAGAMMQFQAFEYLKERNPISAAKAYDAGMSLLRQGHCEARRLIAGIRPPILDELGVFEAVAHLVHEQSRNSGPRIEYYNKIDCDRLVPVLEEAIYRVCQEALANACRHSRSRRVRLRLWQHRNCLRVDVRDWGIGFDASAVPEIVYGLKGIRQRARLLGGKCSIRSVPNQGTRVRVEWPAVLRQET
jgi:two-component system, NarL family, sensor kinase